ncbi:MAG: HNH endonuclease, partial [Acidimicrobiia bacterium]|nr:HNH endonuclease [Acidimicrobiia bacterium]
GFAADDGTGTITATGLQAERVVEIMDRINRISLDLNRGGDTRSIDQIRADVFVDLLAGSKQTKVGTVDILIDVDTLLDLDDRAAEIPGFGPVVAELGREMARVHGARWRAVIRDFDGSLVSSATLRRRPTAEISRHVETRDVTCVFPGCRTPARACDLDHLTPYRERPVTSTDELAAVCRHDHVVRHRYGWTHRRRDDGTHEWTSPLGNRYSRPPP